jgi:hypothetical protein
MYAQTSPQTLICVLARLTQPCRLPTQADDIVAVTTMKVDADLLMPVSSEPAEDAR